MTDHPNLTDGHHIGGLSAGLMKILDHITDIPCVVVDHSHADDDTGKWTLIFGPQLDTIDGVADDDAWPCRNGWLGTEALVWAAVELARSGADVAADVVCTPPMFDPGGSLRFRIAGHTGQAGHLDGESCHPLRYAATLRTFLDTAFRPAGDDDPPAAA